MEVGDEFDRRAFAQIASVVMKSRQVFFIFAFRSVFIRVTLPNYLQPLQAMEPNVSLSDVNLLRATTSRHCSMAG